MPYPILSRETYTPEAPKLLRRARPIALPAKQEGVSLLVRVDGSFVSDPTPGEKSLGHADLAVQVDMRPTVVPLTIELPSQGDAYSFIAQVKLRLNVNDAARCAGAGVDDITAAAEDQVRRWLRPIGRDFEIHESAACEAAMQAELDKVPRTIFDGLGIGIRDASVEVQLDAQAQQHLDTLVQTDRTAAVKVAEQTAQLGVVEAEGKVAVARENAQAAVEAAAGARESAATDRLMRLLSNGDAGLVAEAIRQDPTVVRQIINERQRMQSEKAHIALEALGKILESPHSGDLMFEETLNENIQALSGVLRSFTSAGGLGSAPAGEALPAPEGSLTTPEIDGIRASNAGGSDEPEVDVSHDRSIEPDSDE